MYGTTNLTFWGKEPIMHYSQKVIAVAAIAVSAFSAPVSAKELTPDLYRARVVDFCLYDRWEAAKEGETKVILPGCRCAAKAFVSSLDEKDLARALRRGDVSWSQKRDVRDAYAVCLAQ